MELWIRTQSKQSLVKVDNVSINKQEKERCNIDSGDWILGRYNSYERALEVLDEIQHKLITLCDSMNRKLYVYEMPKEWLNVRNND